eukprot:5600495-Pyramimonas_sp.AAC.1
MGKRGGVYMDIDTISIYTPLQTTGATKRLCFRQTVLPAVQTIHQSDGQPVVQAEAYIGGICNAVMLTKPKSTQVLSLRKWMDQYEHAFEPTKWEEASIFLPYELYSNDYPELVTVVEPDVFFMPTCFETDKIFEKPCANVGPETS